MDKLTQLLLSGAALFLISSASGQVGTEEGLTDARDNLGTIDQFIAKKASLFAINGKENGIFGLPQDPKKALVEKEKESVAVAQPKAAIPLQQILDALPVTMVDPISDRVALKGSPPLSVGETLELAIQDQVVTLRFEGARSNGAYFREVNSKELGCCEMTRLPKGIQRGSQDKKSGGGIHRVTPNQRQAIKLKLNLAGSSRPN